MAFASASVDRDDDWESTAPRVYVQDANLSRSRRDFQLQTFHHEFTHVAAFPLAGPFVPSWVHEGLADWMASGEGDPERPTGRDGVLPEDWEFTTGRRRVDHPGLRREHVGHGLPGRQEGQGRPARPAGPGGRAAGWRRAPSEYRVDQGLRAVYGAGSSQFQKDWNGGW